jgi:hypothetical protein
MLSLSYHKLRLVSANLMKKSSSFFCLALSITGASNYVKPI